MREPRRDRYDVVVIGAGIGGLTCGALLAKAGYRVLVVDQRPVPGGVCHSHQREGFTFDVGSHLLSACGPGWYVHRILSELGVEREVEFIPVDPIAKVSFPDDAVLIRPDYNDFIQRLAQRFPAEEKRLAMLFREMQQMFLEIDSLPHTFSLWEFLKVPIKTPIFVKYPNKTYQQMLDEFLREERLKAMVACLWPYFGLPPAQISAVFWTVVMMAYFLGGGYYPRGGIGRLAEALRKGLERHGGEFLPAHKAQRIAVRGGRVAGVELADVSALWLPDGRLAPDGERLAAGGVHAEVACDTVVSNADARQTFFQLVGQQHLSSSYLRRLQRMEPSLSLVKVSLGVDLEVRELSAAYHDMVFYDSYDMEAIYQRMHRGLPEAPCDITIPSVTDPSLAPPGKHCIYLWNYARYDGASDWPAAGRDLAQKMIRWAERILPGLSQRIVVQDLSTPRTWQRYLLTTEGAPYGWAFSPQQMGFNRLQPRTPIQGLYLAGHWTTPGAGIAGVALSGKRTAEIVQAKEGFALWRKSA
ncbi:MAG: NAD(P)/FAD-dependent oxidoreductase [Chloroflexi bacterium]|nr:NAD(P)/FAD-dependent oxidoreductase [Chloroflexota bacterium]